MKVVELSGGVGGARMARGLSALDGVELTVVVNVGDDLPTHGLYVCPDLDTVTYTLAGMEGPQGWGRAGDSFVTNQELGRFGVDNTFQLGDRDLALKIFRTELLAGGEPLSSITRKVTAGFGIEATVLPATDDQLRTRVTTTEGEVLSFQEYFVGRRHRDHVAALEFSGAESARPAPGVVPAIENADWVVIGPSNPPLSIWPILAVPGVEEAVRSHSRVIAVSPLIGGQAVKGPAVEVLADLGFAPGNRGVLASYRSLVHRFVVHQSDAPGPGDLPGVEVMSLDTLIADKSRATELARAILRP